MLTIPSNMPSDSWRIRCLPRLRRRAILRFPPLRAAAVVIADVSGFTALTEALSGQGSVGVELLTRCMNRYFTQVRPRPRPGIHCSWLDGRMQERRTGASGKPCDGGAARGHARSVPALWWVTDTLPRCPAAPRPTHPHTQVIDLLLLYGGDVEKFAGDCMIVIFPPTSAEAEGTCRRRISGAACCCAGACFWVG